MTHKLVSDAKELTDIALNLDTFVGSVEDHLKLYQRTLALTIAHIGHLTNALHSLEERMSNGHHHESS